MVYCTIELPRLALSNTGNLRSADTITVRPTPTGTALTYTAELDAGRVADFLSPLLEALFALHGRIVMGALRTVLATNVQADSRSAA